MTPSEFLKLLVMVLGYAIVIISLLPLIRSNKWFIRIFDYPRSQKFWINIVLLTTFMFFADGNRGQDIFFLVALFLNQFYLTRQIWSYTPLASIQMKKNENVKNNSIRMLIANVFQDNTQFDRCIAMIRSCNPDIFLLVETDDKWYQKINDAFNKDYRYTVSKPQDNTYGMLLYSRLKTKNTQLRFLIEEDVPSIVTDVEVDKEQYFKLFCLHPKPPVPTESEESTDRDAEILLVGKEAKKCNVPVVVAGDLNDVAWSYTTKLFLKVSGLLDPRIGRGFFSTFHARHRLFRWPLDHVFCSSHFFLHDIKRLPYIGSDHFPIFIEVALMPYKIPENQKEEDSSTPEEQDMADEKIREAIN